VAKALYLSSQNTLDCYNSFCSVSKFFITNTIFFLSWNIYFIISLISITYLALVHNYSNIKCICFISSRQCADLSSRNYENITRTVPKKLYKEITSCFNTWSFLFSFAFNKVYWVFRIGVANGLLFYYFLIF
jgi:hypothetical protein